MWPTNYLTTVDVWEKVGENTRGLVVHVRGTLINIFKKLRQRWGKIVVFNKEYNGLIYNCIGFLLLSSKL